MIYFCSQQNRRALVLQHPTLNGIDYLEVCQTGTDCGCGKQLLVTFLQNVGSANLTSAQISISGGSSTAQVKVLSVTPPTSQAAKTITVNLDQPGDFSTYTFSLVANPTTTDPPDGFDPQLSTVDFSFKAGCPSTSDCLPDNCCAPPIRPKPDINYLAKDYDAFVQVMMDRLAVLAPNWGETHASDIGVATLEALAYAADHLSYQQDAAGTEAYIGTARSRISLRRHARLVDYRIGEGSNARAWVYIQPDPSAPDPLAISAGTLLFPRVPGLAASAAPNSREAQQLETGSTPGFATVQDATLHKEQNEMHFYTWSDADCCLPPGSTQATLSGRFTTLQPGTVLIFEEVMGPDTGDQQDADPTKRWAVRLTKVQSVDYLNRALVDPLNGLPITRIWWAAADALPFPLCISSQTDAAHGSKEVVNVSVARGNIVPADHGLWQDWEDLGTVPDPPPAPVTAASCTCGSPNPIDVVRPRYFPQLSKSPLTFAGSFDPTAAASTFLGGTTAASPVLQVRDEQNREWTILDDLLSSDESQMVAVAEIERDNTVFLRFGDGQYGMAPEAGESFQARYRVGNGSAGNVGRDALAHIVTNAAIAVVRNPLAAAGGTDPESMEHIRQEAPYAFRTQLRAVTQDDYGAMAALDPAIREARGTLRWTGSWYTAFVSVDAAAGDVPTPALVTATGNRLDLLRMAGVDLEVEGAVIVGLRIEMDLCVDADHFQSDVGDAVMRLFTTGNLCNGQPGILNPQNFTFGETIYASPFVAAAQGVDGVSSGTLTVFQRMDDPSSDGTTSGYLTMGRLEIARCDNDPDRLDHGVFVLHMDGGK